MAAKDEAEAKLQEVLKANDAVRAEMAEVQAVAAAAGEVCMCVCVDVKHTHTHTHAHTHTHTHTQVLIFGSIGWNMNPRLGGKQ